MFAVTEPTALPMASASMPWAAAMDDTISSGRVVAKLTTVAPITKAGMPDTQAIQPAASTNISPHLTMRTTPSTNAI